MPSSEKLFEPVGYFIAVATTAFSTVLFYYYSSDLYYSLLAAFLSGLMVWLSYIIMRLLYIASR
jgi:hypothetical protein